MKTKLRNLPLQVKMMGITLSVNLLVFMINIVLLFSINSMADKIDTVYRANLELNELSASIKAVQDNMTEFLNTKTSDALEDYYKSAQEYEEMVEDLDSSVSEKALDRMQRSIKNMSYIYLNEVEQTIEAKRGRNVEKYRERYDDATKLYGYINTYIYSLNNEQFKENSENYRDLVTSFRRFETA